MRFSLKWILAAVVYVAIAAAAFSQESWVYADILWAVSLLAIVFAALMTFLARGKGRAMAAGFLAASVCYLACLAFGQANGKDVVPTKRLLIATGYDPNPAGATFLTWQAPPALPTLSPGPTITPPQPPPAARGYRPSFATAAIAAAPTPVAAVAAVPDFGIYVRAANSVGMMLFGVLGIAVGLFALKRVSQPTRGD